MKLSRLNNSEGERVGYVFHCPGCKSAHQIMVGGPKGWTFNEDVEQPTFGPSYLTWSDREPGKFRCHSFIEAGQIRFLSDCTHDLAGKTVELPDWPGW